MNWYSVTVFLLSYLVGCMYAMEQQDVPQSDIAKENKRFLKSSQEFDKFLEEKNDVPLPIDQLLGYVVRHYSREEIIKITKQNKSSDSTVNGLID